MMQQNGKTHVHEYQPCGTVVLPNTILCFGICKCGFSVGTMPYLQGVEIDKAEQEQEHNKDQLVLPFGKGNKA